MKTLLVTANDRPGLSPLTDNSAGALLPVVDKPILIHTIEDLARAGIKDVIVFATHFSSQVSATLDDGDRWGVRFDYVAAQQPDAEALQRIIEEVNDDLLLVRGDMLRAPIVAEFLAQVASNNSAIAEAAIAGQSAGISFVRRGFAAAGSRLVLSHPSKLRGHSELIDFPDARFSSIESLSEFHRANLDVLNGRFPGLILAGRVEHPGVRVGSKSRLPIKSTRGEPIFVGARCQVASDSELMSGTIVCSDSVIDRGAILHRSVVMPRTYVGAMLELSNAIVAGDLLIDVDTGAHTRVAESFMLASIDARPLAAAVRDAAARLRAILGMASSKAPVSSEPKKGSDDVAVEELQSR
ncbi:MAG TPA: NDP-sugar synthase [Candidatus Binataceae bacterium]|nr:NDP-sugar synthase [Candidatus Binataceae bacterium]